MDKDSIWVKMIIGVVAAILVSVGGIIVFEAHQYYQKVPVSSYYLYGGYSVVDNLKPNLLYNQSSIDNPGTIYNSISSSVNVSLFYDVELSNMTGRDVTIFNTVTLVSTNPSWTKTVSTNITYLNNVKENTQSAPIRVNMSKDLALANNIDNQLQEGNSAPTLDFNLSVRVTGLPQFNTSIDIELHNVYETVYYKPTQAMSSTQFKNELIVPDSVIGLNRDFGYVFLGTAGGLAVYFAYLYAPRTTDPVKRIRKEHGEQIVEISTPVGNNATKIENLEDLLKMSEIFEVPVFLYDPDKVLYINHQGYQYYYDII